MEFEQKREAGKVGRIIGYALSYTLFTAILFFALTLLKKMPITWGIWHIMAITTSVALCGWLSRRLLR